MKPAEQYIEYAGDLKAARLMNGPEFFFGGSRRSIVRFVTARAAIMMNASIRIVHGNLAGTTNGGSTGGGLRGGSDVPYSKDEVSCSDGEERPAATRADGDHT